MSATVSFLPGVVCFGIALNGSTDTGVNLSSFGAMQLYEQELTAFGNFAGNNSIANTEIGRDVPFLGYVDPS